MSRTLSESLILEGLLALRETSRYKVSPGDVEMINEIQSEKGAGAAGLAIRVRGVGGPGAVKIRNNPIQNIFDRLKGGIKGNIQKAKDQGITPTYNRVRDDSGGHIEVRYPGSQSIGSFEISGGRTRGPNPDAYSYDILNVFKRK